MAVPDLVVAARAAAEAAEFPFSCADQVGQLLSVLAAAVPPNGRILELGTGAGVGTAWIVHGLGPRRDVELTTVDWAPEMSDLARGNPWPDYVRFLVEDAVAVLPTLGAFDLIFADSPGGKWQGLVLTIEALRPGGVLVVDDMMPQVDWTEEQAANQERVHETLLHHPELVSCDLKWATGVLLSVRCSPAGLHTRR